MTDEMELVHWSSVVDQLENVFGDSFSDNLQLGNDSQVVLHVLGVVAPVKTDDVVIATVEVGTTNGECAQVGLTRFEPAVHVDNSGSVDVEACVFNEVWEIAERHVNDMSLVLAVETLTFEKNSTFFQSTYV